jgi:predicted PurR-regulated permease PerM
LPAADLAAAHDEGMVEPGRYGEPGPRVRISPFLFGLLATAGGLLAIVVLIFFCLYQGGENWVIYPRVMSRAVKISNLAAIVAAMAGWALFGVLGVLIAVPAYGSLQLLVQEVLIPRQEGR